MGSPTVDLSGLNVCSFADDEGQVWPDDIQLRLEGFVYQHISNEKLSGNASDRKRWLKLQYQGGEPTRSSFRPQPYEQLAKVLTNHGAINDAKAILVEKLKAERLLVPKLFWPIYWLYGLAFSYGLSARRALVTFTLFIILGWVGVKTADNAGMLIIDASHVTTIAVAGQAATPTLRTEAPTSIPWDNVSVTPWVYATPRPSKQVLLEIPCGNAITPWIYALDLALPLLDLHEERRCMVRPPRAADEGLAAYPWGGSLKAASLWRWGRAIYAFIGWVVTSLTLLTVTGVLRRAAER